MMDGCFLLQLRNFVEIGAEQLCSFDVIADVQFLVLAVSSVITSMKKVLLDNRGKN